jgi:hypothetical protein
VAARKQQLEPIVLGPWPKGANLTTHPSLLGPDELAHAGNAILGPKGEIRQRPAFVLTPPFENVSGPIDILAFNYDSVNWDSEGGGSPILATFTFLVTTNDGLGNIDTYFMGSHDGNFVDAIATDPTGVGGFPTTLSGRGLQIVALNGEYFVHATKNYLTGQRGAGFWFEITIPGSGDPTVNLEPSWAGGSNTTTEIPLAPIALVAYERLFMAAASVSSGNPSRIHWSEPLLPRSWNTTSFLDVYPDDEQGISALRLFADQLVVFKERSIWGIAGKDFSSLDGIELFQIDGSLGCSLERTICEMGPVLAFMDPRNGIFLYDGSAFHNIGEPVFDYMRANWNAEYLNLAIAWVADGRYHISLPMGVNTEPSITFVFDAVHQAWTTWSQGFSGATAAVEFFSDTGTAVPREAQVFAVQGSESSGIRKIDPDAYAEDSPIPVEIVTGWISPSGGLSRHRLQQVVLQTSDTTDTVASVDFFRDFDSLITESIFFEPTLEEDGKHWRTHAFNPYRWRALRFETGATVGTDETSPFELTAIRALASSLGSARGESSGISLVG